MSIQVKCSNCIKGFKVKDQYAGQTGLCPYCSHQVVVPELAPVSTMVTDDEMLSVEYTQKSENGKSSRSSLSLVTRVPKAPCPKCGKLNLVGNPSCFYCSTSLV